MGGSEPKYKLLIVDVDGTLVGSSGVVTAPVSKAVIAAQERGIQVALCSGRPLASCWPIVESLGLRGPLVVFNGALVKDPREAQVILSQPLPTNAAKEVVQFCREQELCLELYTEDTHFVERDWRESRLHGISIRVSYEFSDFDDLLQTRQIIKAQIITSDDRGRRLAEDLATQLDGRLAFSVAIPMAPCEGMEMVNVVEQSVSKGRAVRALIAHCGLSRAEVVAAGDAPNDLPVFEEVGYRIAMAGGDAAILAAADYITPSVEEDGLALAIERVLL